MNQAEFSQQKNQMRKLVIGTRGSKLALIQAESIQLMLTENSDFEVEIRIIKTKGDKDLKLSLSSGNTTGIFTRAIEKKLSIGKIDIAVHSLKDLPLKQPDDLTIAAIPKRESISETLVVNSELIAPKNYLFPIKPDAVIGTSSQRRRRQILSKNKDVVVKEIRGNLDTRLSKIKSGEYGASIFAAAGLNRLKPDLSDFRVFDLDNKEFPSSPGQGALAIEMRIEDPLRDRIKGMLNDDITEKCIKAERGILEMFGGGCALPLGVNIHFNGQEFYSNSFYWDSDGCRRYSDNHRNIENLIENIYKHLKSKSSI